jgi:ribosomal protein S18 acetylase RimI-like enzyme
MAEIKDTKIRVLKKGDLDAIIEIDREVLGRARPEYWQMKVELLQSRSPIASLVATSNGKVVGFILGEASGWEFGIPDTVGWIHTIGVTPAFQKKGVARLLVKEMIAHLKKVGVNSIYILVNWRDWDLLKFFEKGGFTRGDMMNLELKV